MVAVFAAGQAIQPTRIALDHPILFNSLTRIAHNPLAQLFEAGGGGRAVEQRVDIVEIIVKHGRPYAILRRIGKGQSAVNALPRYLHQPGIPVLGRCVGVQSDIPA